MVKADPRRHAWRVYIVTVTHERWPAAAVWLWGRGEFWVLIRSQALARLHVADLEIPGTSASHHQVDFCRENYDIIWLCIYTVLSLFTRLYRIGRSNTVVWDEVRYPYNTIITIFSKNSHFVE